MATHYGALAQHVLDLVGGPDNINSVYHCQTRLRFTLRDETKAQADTLTSTDGVVSALSSGGVFQVVIGMHVKDVYDEIENLLPQSDGAQEDGADSAGKRGTVETVLDVVAGTFQQIVPPLVAAGMTKGLHALLLLTGIVAEESAISVVLGLIADGILYLLPVLVAFAAAGKLRCNRFIAAASAGVLLGAGWLVDYPTGSSLVGASLVTVALMVIAQTYLERLLNKFFPTSLRLAFVPMTTVVVMCSLGLTVFDTIGRLADTYLAIGFEALATRAAWIPAVIIGAFLPLMVMRGLHQAVATLAVLQVALIGIESIFGPGALVSNFAQATAATVVAFRSKDRGLLKLSSAGFVGGITEPILYGVNLPKRYPLIAAMIGGAAGGLYVGLTQTHQIGFGTSSLPSLLLYLNAETPASFYNILIALGIAMSITAALTVVLALRHEKSTAVEPASTLAPAAVVAESTEPPPQTGNESVFFSPCLGAAPCSRRCRRSSLLHRRDGTGRRDQAH